jgi:hypothetical protein
MTEIDGLDIHFIHVRSQHQGALPLIVTHGWPGSIIEQLKIIGPLTNPTPAAISKAVQRGDPPPPDLTAEERRAYEQLSGFYAKHVAYALIMATRPQTLYGLADSPVDLAAGGVPDVALARHWPALMAGTSSRRRALL